MVDEEVRDINLTVQYLDWAMVTALRLQNPDCKKVTIVFDLERSQSITSYEKKENLK